MANPIDTPKVATHFAEIAAPRPRPYDMSHDYTTWEGLVDRSWTGRHLPPARRAFIQSAPPAAQVVDLFKRDSFVPSNATSTMFMFFAQWFTDSFLRTDARDFRRNTSNHEVDLCQIYGLKESKTKMLRAGHGGLLAHQIIRGEEFPRFLFTRQNGRMVIHPDFSGRFNDEPLHDPALTDAIMGGLSDARKATLFAVGLEHGNSTAGYSACNILFLRAHNHVARQLAKAHPRWPDERLFQTARNVMIVVALKIVIQDYISHVTAGDSQIPLTPGAADHARWGKANRIAIEFNLLYRWHSMIPNKVNVAGTMVNAATLVHDNSVLLDEDIGTLITGFSQHKAGKISLRNTPGFMFRAPPGGRSTVGNTVHLMRQARLRSFNDYRRAFSQGPVTSFQRLTRDAELAADLDRMYGGDIDNLEWYVGLFAQAPRDGAPMGSLLTAMVAHDAFTQVLTNPLLSGEIYNTRTFSETGMAFIDSINSLSDVAKLVTGNNTLCSFTI